MLGCLCTNSYTLQIWYPYNERIRCTYRSGGCIQHMGIGSYFEERVQQPKEHHSQYLLI
jgi:hypothetical protein